MQTSQINYRELAENKLNKLGITNIISIVDYARTLRLYDELKDSYKKDSYEEKQLINKLEDCINTVEDPDLSEDAKKDKFIPDKATLKGVNRMLAHKYGLTFPESDPEYVLLDYDEHVPDLIKQEEEKKQRDKIYQDNAKGAYLFADQIERGKYTNLGLNYDTLEASDKIPNRIASEFIKREAKKSTKNQNKINKTNMDLCFGQGNVNKEKLKNTIKAYLNAKMIQKNRPKPWFWQLFTKKARENEEKMLNEWRDKIVRTGAVTLNELKNYNVLSDNFFDKKVDAAKNIPEKDAIVEEKKDLSEVRKTLNEVDMNKLKLDTNSELGKETSEMKINDPNAVKQKEIGKNNL